MIGLRPSCFPVFRPIGSGRPFCKDDARCAHKARTQTEEESEDNMVTMVVVILVVTMVAAGVYALSRILS